MNEEVDFDADLNYSTMDNVKRRNYQTVIRNFPVKKFDCPEQENSKDDYDFSCELNDGTILNILIDGQEITT